MVKLSNVLIGVVVVFMIMVGIQFFISSGVSHYGITDVDNTTFEKLQSNYEDMQNIVNETRNKVSSTDSDRSIVDIVGDFLSQALGAFRITARSVDIYSDMTNTAIDSLDLDNGYGNILIIAIGAIIIIIIVVAIGLEIITKSQRL